MARLIQARCRPFRWLLPVLALGAAAVLGGCVAYPDGYYGYNYGYGYSPGYYDYSPPPYVAFGFGGDWGDHDWGDHDGGGHDWHGGWGHDHH